MLDDTGKLHTFLKKNLVVGLYHIILIISFDPGMLRL